LEDDAVAGPQPPYLRIAAALRDQIGAGELAPGDRVPSARQITREWGVAIATAAKVLATLRDEGLVESLPGTGTVVRSTTRRPAARRGGTVRGAPHLSRERIVRIAVDIADDEGLSALSIRRIAATLDVATMSLYRHIPGRDQLLLFMADAAFGEAPLPAQPPTGWRMQLELAARAQWAVYHRHPWLAQIMAINRPLSPPHALAHMEWTLRALDGLNLTPNAAVHAAVTLFSFVRGLAVDLEAEAHAQQDTGITDQQWMDAHGSPRTAVPRSGDFPTFHRLTAASNLTLDTLFEFGLRQILDGLAFQHTAGASTGA
jgi:DNA-binding transcriptional regulator YhcF (GntR family)